MCRATQLVSVELKFQTAAAWLRIHAGHSWTSAVVCLEESRLWKKDLGAEQCVL